jgi:hypothetical protein
LQKTYNTKKDKYESIFWKGIRKTQKISCQLHENNGDVSCIIFSFWNELLIFFSYLNEKILFVIVFYNLCQKLWDSCCNFIKFERNSAPPPPPPPFPQFNVGPTKTWCLDARRQHWNGWGREGGKMYQEMVYYNRMHVKTRLSQSILSKIVCWSNTITFKFNLIQHVDIIKLSTQLYFHNFFIPFRSFSNFVAHGQFSCIVLYNVCVCVC